jgi:integrase/recombinase XerD
MMADIRQMPLFPNQPASVEDLNKRTEMRHTIALFQDYLIKEGKSEHTIKAFTADLQLLAEHSGEHTPIGEFTTNGLNAFLDWLEHGRGVPCSRKSYARRVTTIKVYFKWLHASKAIQHDPAKAVLQRSGPAPLATILSPAEVGDALAFAKSMGRSEKPDARPEMLFRLILDTGIKKSEAIALTREHIDRTNPEEPFLKVKHKVHNVYKERTIILDPDWLKILDAYLMQYAPQTTIFNCTARNLEYVLEDISDGAGIPVKISFEMLRWTCGVRDYQAGMDPEWIRDKLGLSDASWQETFGKIKKLAEMQVKSSL